MTGQRGVRTIEMNGGSTASYLARARPLRPCVFSLFEKVWKQRGFRLPGATWDHFRCAQQVLNVGA